MIRVWLRTVMWGPVLGYALAIYWMSSQPAPEAAHQLDFELHALAYALLGALVTRALYFTTRTSWTRVGLLSFLGATAYGITDELHQAFVPGRSADVADVGADALGALLGTGLTLAMYGVAQVWAAREGLPSPRRVPGGPTS